MKKEYISLLICPYCHGNLSLKISKEENDEIIEGKLICNNCKREYDIKDGIPKMI
ncbi:MAG: Trm112 family protein [Thermoplasmata archaeon]|nr:Trm112 family protein [Thermoplasmata archaeon]